MFDDDAHLWTNELLLELRQAFTGNPLEGSDAFLEKFKQQLASRRPELIRLAAEMLWLLFLFPRKLMLPARKREVITTVWSWSGNSLNPAHPLLSDRILAGIGSAGTAYNTQRDRELDALIEATLQLKLDGANDGWEVAAAFDTHPKLARRGIRNILLHLLFPDEFERVSSLDQKRKIVAAFWDLLGAAPAPLTTTSSEIDRKLLQIRARLEEQSPGREIDFYDPELVERWAPHEEQEVKREWRPKVKETARPTPTGQPSKTLRNRALEPNEQAAAGLKLAEQLAREVKLREPTPAILLAALLLLMNNRDHGSRSGAVIHKAMSEALSGQGRSGAPQDLLLAPHRDAVASRGDGPPLVTNGPAITDFVEAATAICILVGDDKLQRLSPRHLLAVLLRRGPHSAAPVLEAQGFDTAELRRALLSSLENRALGERKEMWRH
ncbi:MAG TPA: Clp protease N-terminal domain-containing protein, partial [Longimicrobium sp.]|nr:Clp protease N-terminal domain-containing protein [Longimicrobium sp.]